MAQPATHLYNARGEQTEVLYVNNQRLSTVYDALGQARAHADPSGVTTQSAPKGAGAEHPEDGVERSPVVGPGLHISGRDKNLVR